MFGTADELPLCASCDRALTGDDPDEDLTGNHDRLPIGIVGRVAGAVGTPGWPIDFLVGRPVAPTGSPDAVG